jgi:hypothetical protein
MNYLNSLESYLNPLFTNKYFLYAIVFLSATSNLGYLLANNINAVGFFIIIGIIMVNFSKNMAVVLTVCLVATNFLVATKTREGMKNPFTTEGFEEDEDEKEGFEGGDDEDEKEGFEGGGDDEDEKEGFEGGDDDEDVKEGFEGGGDDEDEGFEMPEKKKDGDAPPGGTPQLDYGQSATNAYKDLDNILDPAAIDKLTKETMELMEQQQTLYTSMQSMAPLLSQANTLLKGFDMTKLQSLASGATSLSAEDEETSKSAVAGVDMKQLMSLTADMEKLKGTTEGYKSRDSKEGFVGMRGFFNHFLNLA